MTKSDNNQPLIRVYTHKNIINMVLIGLTINIQNYFELFSNKLMSPLVLGASKT